MLKGSLLTLLGERSCDNWKALLLEKKAKSMNASHSQKDKKRETVICLASQFNIVFIKPHEQVCLSTHRVWSDSLY